MPKPEKQAVNASTNTQRVDLGPVLKGHHVVVDLDRFTFGTLEDFQTGQVNLVMDHLAQIIVGGELPHGTDREGLRRLGLMAGGELTAAVIRAANAQSDSQTAS